MNVIEVTGLTKTYGTFTAVNNISFNVKQGEIFGIVGPNGAGKSTTVEAIMGLRTPDGGTLKVLGLDPHKDREQVAQRIGIQLQQAALADRMKVWEALDLFSSFYDHTVPYEPLLEEWGLTEKREAHFRNLSGGQKQRLFIALALLNDPEVVFLDELTTGLDPQARRKTWELVSKIRDQGKTVVLVTHFMDEAESLCDRIAIIDAGQIVALDTPERLIEKVGGEQQVIFETQQPVDMAALRSVPCVTHVAQQGDEFIVTGNSNRLIVDLVLMLEREQVDIKRLRTEQPDLEDVFIALTGHALRA